MTEPFVAAENVTTSFRLRPWLAGGLVLHSGEGWTRRFPDGVNRSEPVPAWLADRPDSDLQVVRGGRAYALLPSPREGHFTACPSSIELRAPDGTVCGTVTVPLTDDGSSCLLARLEVGQDGTVFHTQGCTFRWWPRLLR